MTVHKRAFALVSLLLLGACGPVVAPTIVPAVTTVEPSRSAIAPSDLAPSESPTEVDAQPTAVPPSVRKGNADVVHVRAVQAADGSWTFHVTVKHPDAGWEDYADGWDVVTPDEAVLKPDPDSPFTRLLLHPHVDEQPFTRSKSGILIPVGVTQVRVRAHDLLDGWGGREVAVDLTTPSGPGFVVERRP